MLLENKNCHYQTGRGKWTECYSQFFMTAVTCFHKQMQNLQKNQEVSYCLQCSPVSRLFKRECLLLKWWDVSHFLKLIIQSKKNRAQLQRFKEQVNNVTKVVQLLKDVGCSHRIYPEAVATAKNIPTQQDLPASRSFKDCISFDLVHKKIKIKLIKWILPDSCITTANLYHRSIS